MLSTISLSCPNMLAFDSADLDAQVCARLSPLILSINIYVQPFRLKAQYILGTGIEVLRAMNAIVDASGKCRNGPYFTQRVPVRNIIIPFLGRKRPRILMAPSTKKRSNQVSLMDPACAVRCTAFSALIVEINKSAR